MTNINTPNETIINNTGSTYNVANNPILIYHKTNFHPVGRPSFVDILYFLMDRFMIVCNSIYTEERRKLFIIVI